MEEEPKRAEWISTYELPSLLKYGNESLSVSINITLHHQHNNSLVIDNYVH